MPNLCIIPARILAMDDVSETDLRVLLAIARHADRFGANVWASAETLSGVAGVSRRSFFRSASRLIDLGVVRRTKRWKDNGEPDTSMYAVLLDEPVEAGGSDTALALGSDSSLAVPSDTALAVRSDRAVAHKRPLERQKELKASSPARVCDALRHEHHRAAYHALTQHNVAGQRAIDYELLLAAEGGERPGVGLLPPEGWERVGEALHQLVVAGRQFSSRSLGTYLAGLDPLPVLPARSSPTASAAVPMPDEDDDPLTKVGL